MGDNANPPHLFSVGPFPLRPWHLKEIKFHGQFNLGTLRLYPLLKPADYVKGAVEFNWTLRTVLKTLKGELTTIQREIDNLETEKFRTDVNGTRTQVGTLSNGAQRITYACKLHMLGLVTLKGCLSFRNQGATLVDKITLDYLASVFGYGKNVGAPAKNKQENTCWKPDVDPEELVKWKVLLHYHSKMTHPAYVRLCFKKDQVFLNDHHQVWEATHLLQRDTTLNRVIATLNELLMEGGNYKKNIKALRARLQKRVDDRTEYVFKVEEALARRYPLRVDLINAVSILLNQKTELRLIDNPDFEGVSAKDLTRMEERDVTDNDDASDDSTNASDDATDASDDASDDATDVSDDVTDASDDATSN